MPSTPYFNKDCGYSTPNQTVLPVNGNVNGWLSPNTPVTPPCCEMPQVRNFIEEHILWGLQTIISPLLVLIQSQGAGGGSSSTTLLVTDAHFQTFATANHTDLVQLHIDLTKTATNNGVTKDIVGWLAFISGPGAYSLYDLYSIISNVDTQTAMTNTKLDTIITLLTAQNATLAGGGQNVNIISPINLGHVVVGA